jgi:hypothetical protein
MNAEGSIGIPVHRLGWRSQPELKREPRSHSDHFLKSNLCAKVNAKVTSKRRRSEKRTRLISINSEHSADWVWGAPRTLAPGGFVLG